jgi:dethiobiotin synthetase
MTQGYFITGTDTGIGKTELTLALMHALQARGLTIAGMKPVASGCVRTPDGLRHDDALRLQAKSSLTLPYEQVNPYAFEPAIAPHLAAAEAGREIGIGHIAAIYRVIAGRADGVCVEGVGGWRVPLSADTTLADLAREIGLPVILVVGMRLGCLNHAQLTAEAIEADGVRLAGWVANHVAPGFERAEANLAALQARLPAPLLGVLPCRRQPQAADLAACLQDI